MAALFLAGCSGRSSDLSDPPDGFPPPTASPFTLCQVITTDDAGYANGFKDYGCAEMTPDSGVEAIKWGWAGNGFAGSCTGDRDAACTFGSPCVVATSTTYVQGGCL